MHLKATVDPPPPSEAEPFLQDVATAHRIVRLASRSLGAPAAALWLSSGSGARLAASSGLALLPGPLEVMPAEIEFAIDGGLVSGDLSLDRAPRARAFARLAPRARSAVVVPVHGSSGRRLGILAALDIEARSFDADDEAALADHAVLLAEALDRGHAELAPGAPRSPSDGARSAGEEGGRARAGGDGGERRLSPEDRERTRDEGAAVRQAKSTAHELTHVEIEQRVEQRIEEFRLTQERLAHEQKARQHAEEKYRILIRNFPDTTVLLLDRDLRFLMAEGKSLDAVGTEGIIGKRLHEVVSSTTHQLVEPLYRAAFAGKSSVTEVRRGDRVYLGKIGPVRREDGEIIAAMLVAQDITPRVIAEAALRESEERYRLLFERAGEAILIMAASEDTGGRILEANTAAAAMHGYTVEELRGMALLDLDAPEVALATQGNIRRIGDGEWIEGETMHMRRDGQRFPVEYAAGPLDLGRRRFLITFMRDITERKRGEEALRKAKDTADAASRAKSAFLANMSHEIRTPMNAILGYTQLLQRDPKMTPSQRQSVEVISRSGEHLLSLINDVLEMSKIEAGHRRVTRAEVDLTALLDDLERMFRLRAEAKRLTFEILRAPDLPRSVMADEGKLRQVLVNLLGNAVKFTERGGVTARIIVQRRPEGDAQIVAEIEDTGPGIDPEEAVGLFRPFAQARVGILAQGGTGLGLALSREFARLMGGDITVQSHIGQGSVFRLQIPVEIGAVSTTYVPPPPRGRVMGVAGEERRRRILLVDDDEDNRSWTQRLLAQMGFDIREATNGVEALARFDEWRPHLVLMDMNMPVMDGYAAIRAIRSRPSGRGTAIVAVTASAFDEERDAIFEAGADGWLRKPCLEGELLEEIRKQLGIEYHYAQASATERPSLLPTLMTHSHEYVQALPVPLVSALREAVQVADYERLTELLLQIPIEHAAVAEALRELVDRYEYEELDAILRGESSA
jgi:PAS domain S-box-containing protein